jgi:hypothetical protein
MKMKRSYILIFLTGIFFYSCEEKPTLYNETDGLYFGTADTIMSYSFAKYPKKEIDTIHVPVQVLGSTSLADRSIDINLLQQAGDSAAVEGVHFKLVADPKVAANSVTGTVPIVVYRTADLESGKMVRFAIQLKLNNDFPSQGIASKQKLIVNLAYIQRPLNWGEFTGAITGYFAGYKDNFGTWTPTKYKLILDALYDPTTGTTVTEFPVSRFSPPIVYNHYVAIVRNYIKTHYPGNYGLAGAVLLDPDNDNLPIQVGPANY